MFVVLFFFFWQILFSTETFAMGVNAPARTVSCYKDGYFFSSLVALFSEIHFEINIYEYTFCLPLLG